MDSISKKRIFDAGLFLALVVLGISSRIWLVEFPNIKPVAALCLFAGFYFQSYVRAFAAAFMVLLISDWFLGGYELAVALSVYLSMGVACGLGYLVQRWIRSEAGQVGLSLNQCGGMVAASLVMSTMFFLLTNLAVWMFLPWYETTLSGLIHCFTAAVPFYRYTLIGDLTFTLAVFSAYQLVSVFVASKRSARVLA